MIPVVSKMTVEQWGIRVPLGEGEPVRQTLIREGALDPALKPRRDGEALLLPVLAWREGAMMCGFEPMPDRPILPHHELVGGIAIMQDCDPAGAEQILGSRPSLHTVLYATSEVSGEYRTRDYTVLAGTPTTRTQVTEHGHRFTVDLAGVYFSARLSTERNRILQHMGDQELVLDMFAGVGPFAISLAARAALVVASDINPLAIELMIENCVQNRTKNVLPVLADVRNLIGILPWQFDRIVMNLPLAGTEFLPEAFRLCRPGGTIHFYALVSQEGEYLARLRELGAEHITERMVRSYSPGQWHAVYDIVVGKK
jgi:tRNA (guanine37-N1)-methyltransferase